MFSTTPMENSLLISCVFPPPLKSSRGSTTRRLASPTPSPGERACAIFSRLWEGRNPGLGRFSGNGSWRPGPTPCPSFFSRARAEAVTIFGWEFSPASTEMKWRARWPPCGSCSSSRMSRKSRAVTRSMSILYAIPRVSRMAPVTRGAAAISTGNSGSAPTRPRCAYWSAKSAPFVLTGSFPCMRTMNRRGSMLLLSAPR